MKKEIIIALTIITIYFMPKQVFASDGIHNTDSDIDFKNSNSNQILSNDEDILKEQEDNYGISGFIKNAEKYSEEFDISEIFNSSVTGNFDNNKIIRTITTLLGKNIKEAITTLIGVIVIIIIHSILKSISENLGNESVSKIAYYIQYILIVTLVMKNFSNIITMIKSSIQDLTAFSNSLIPLMSTLMIATGNITTTSMIEPILIIIVTFIGNFITKALIPIILVATALEITSKISDQVQVDKLSKYLKKGTIWVLTTVLTLFISIASLEGKLTSGVDGITLKAGKSIVSASVPVVGKILGDAVDTILGYGNIIKNSVGIVGIFVILGICIKPILNLTALTITYYLGASLCQPIADEKIVNLIEQIAGTFKILLAVMFTITAMLIIGIAVVMRVSNSGVMYG